MDNAEFADNSTFSLPQLHQLMKHLSALIVEHLSVSLNV